MPTFYDANNQELSPGQALDVWLGSQGESRSDQIAADIHLFADACEGYQTPHRIVWNSGIEIRFEGKAE